MFFFSKKQYKCWDFTLQTGPVCASREDLYNIVHVDQVRGTFGMLKFGRQIKQVGQVEIKRWAGWRLGMLSWLGKLGRLTGWAGWAE